MLADVCLINRNKAGKSNAAVVNQRQEILIRKIREPVPCKVPASVQRIQIDVGWGNRRQGRALEGGGNVTVGGIKC